MSEIEQAFNKDQPEPVDPERAARLTEILTGLLATL
jgi:hypothetical protein